MPDATELRRFLAGLEAGEVWRDWPGVPGGWKLACPHAQALVKPVAGGAWAWGVRLLSNGDLHGGTVDSDHEAMRAAERVLEEFRPASGTGYQTP